MSYVTAYFESLSTLGIVCHVTLGAIFTWYLCRVVDTWIGRAISRRRDRRYVAQVLRECEAHRERLAHPAKHPQAWQQIRRPQAVAYDGEYANTTRLTSQPRGDSAA